MYKSASGTAAASESHANLGPFIVPLNLLEFFYFRDMLMASDADLATADFFKGASDELVSRFRVNATAFWITPEQLRNICDITKAMFSQGIWDRDAAGSTTMHAHEGLRHQGIQFAAAPVVTYCLNPACCCNPQGKHAAGIVLETRKESHRPFFYTEEVMPPGKGILYEKVCTSCGAVYQLDGYILPRTCDSSAQPPAGAHDDSHPRNLPSVKRPYPPVYHHPRWFRSSRETVVHNRVFRRFSAELIYQHASFSSSSKTQAYTFGIGMYALNPPFWITCMHMYMISGSSLKNLFAGSRASMIISCTPHVQINRCYY